MGLPKSKIKEIITNVGNNYTKNQELDFLINQGISLNQINHVIKDLIMDSEKKFFIKKVIKNYYYYHMKIYRKKRKHDKS